MRIVTIGALHYAFIDAMLEGHIELCAYGRVAVVAKVRLRFRQQKLRSPGSMNGMAARTGDIRESMFGAAYLGSRQVFRMTGQAIV